ncbi:MAG: glycosyltransferase family protein [Shewanella sp.]
MRILYGVQGSGHGHISRARLLADALSLQQIQVDFLFSGGRPEYYFDMAAFGDYRLYPGMPLSQGLTGFSAPCAIASSPIASSPIVSIPNVSSLGIARSNDAPLARRGLLGLLKDIHALDLTAYDLVLNDFEPITAWGAKRQGVPSIGISHQAAFRHPVPKQGDSWLNALRLEYFAPVDIALGCHWHHFGCALLPPLVEVAASCCEYPHQILVYLPLEDADGIALFLAAFKDYQFLVYHPALPAGQIAEHIHWHVLNREGFKRHLACCGGVISHGGFELASEALTLGKKLLVKPLRGQFEQQSNAAALALLAAADTMDHLDAHVLKRWLKAASPRPIAYPPVAPALVDWIQAGDWQRSHELCEQLWQQVSLPESWR